MSDESNPTKNYKDSPQDEVLNIVAYMFAGLAMMLNIRLSYSAAPYALLRFKLPENLFSVFVRTTSSALELWCIPSMLIGNIMEQVYNGNQDTALYHTSGLTNYATTLKEKAQTLNGEAEKLRNEAANQASRSGPLSALQSHAEGLKDAAKKDSNDNTSLHKKAEELAGNPNDPEKAKAVIEAFNNVCSKYNEMSSQPAYSAVVDKIKQNQPIAPGSDDQKVQAVYDAYNKLHDEYSNAIYQYKWYLITMPSMLTNWLNFLTFVILLIVFVTGGDNGHVTGYYVIMAISGFVFGINMVLVYAVDYRYLPFYMAGENSFPMVTSLILYFATSIFGNRRKYNSDYLVVVIDVSIAILIAFVASVLWTVAFYNYRAPKSSGLTPDPWPLISPVAMVIVGMGLVYSIYPGIAPGMIVPFYLIDKIEMVLLVATAFPPVIIAILRLKAQNWSPSTKFVWHGFMATNNGMGGWKSYPDKGPKHEDKVQGPEAACEDDSEGKHITVHAWIWHFFDLLIPLKIILAIIFIYSIHYRDSNLSRSIVNQPKMSTALTIIFYMCHEILLALGFPGMVANGGAGGAVLLPTQYVGALLMVFLAFYSIGYITEYKKHDPSEWPTDGMTWWNSVCYWLKMASKITNKNFKQLFTNDLIRDPHFSKNNIINTIIYYTLLD